MQNARDLTQEYLKRAKGHNLEISVLGDGAFHSEIALVGEAPGEREVQTKIPFSGGAGKVLWDALRKHSYTRQTVYITNVVKRQLSLSRHTEKRSPIHRCELQHWIELVRWEVSQLPNVKVIVALGNYALQAFAGESGIKNWRGSVFDVQLGNRTIKCVATYNPAMVLRDPETEVLFKFDIAKVERVMTGKYEPYHIDAHFNMLADEALFAIERIHTLASDGAPVSFDIEVLSNETACVGLAADSHSGYCFNFRDQRTNRYSAVEERAIRRAINALLSDTNVKLVAQNGVFDSYWLWYKDRVRVHSIWFDTLLAHHTLYPTLPHSLGALTTQYTDHPYYKDEGKNWRETGEIDKFWTYNVKDCCLTLDIHKKLLKELTSAGLDEFFFSHVMRLQPKLVRATVIGVKCDVGLKTHLVDSIRDDTAQLANTFHTKVRAATGTDDYYPNPNSPQQLSELFFRKLKLVGRGTATDEENRVRMKKHPGTSTAAIEMLNALDRYKEEYKFLSTYAEMVIDPDERIRCEYKQFGTQAAPGRLSSAKVMWGSGMNLQNQPKRAQAMFVADPGFGFGYFDLSQAEARYVAWDAWIPEWVEQFERARKDGLYDAHRALASDMFGVPYDEVPKEDRKPDGTPTIRYIAKRCRHGLNYRMGSDRLATVTGLDAHVAQEAYDIYHSKTPQLRVWWDTLIGLVKRNRLLYNSYGRRLIFLNRLTEESALDSVVAFRPQSSIGDKVCRVWYQSEDDPQWPTNARICLNVHDALICLAPVTKLKTCLAIMKRYAEEPVVVKSTVTGKENEMIIPAEVKMSYPVAWEYKDGELMFTPDTRGSHRWSHLKTVEL